MKLSVNILNWNTGGTLEQTLDVLKEDLKDIEHEIIVVDQGSVDGSIKLLKELAESDKIIAIFNETNVGISKGKNQGIEMSFGKYIMFVDGDVVPVPNSINMLIDYLDKNEDVQAMGFHPNKFTDTKDKCEERCTRLSLPRIINRACIYYGMFRRSVFDTIKLSEEGEFGKPGYGWEDYDLLQQMNRDNVRQWMAGINHDDGRYLHLINSSFKREGNMTHQEYVSTSQERGKYYKRKWKQGKIGSVA